MATKKAKAFAWVAILGLLLTTLSSIFLGNRSTKAASLTPAGAQAVADCMAGQGWSPLFQKRGSDYLFYVTATLDDQQQKEFDAVEKSCRDSLK